MTDNIYILDTSAILGIFKQYPPDLFRQIWTSLNEHLDALIKTGRLIIVDFVKEEIIHTEGKREDGSDDPAVVWLKKYADYIIPLSNDIEIYRQVQKILEYFPHTVKPGKTPPQADPYLIAYPLAKGNQQLLDGTHPHFVIVTQEIRNLNVNITKLKKHKPPIPELSKIRSICDYYGIETMEYLDMFRAEGWTF